MARIPDSFLKLKDQAGHQSRSLPSTWEVAEGTPKSAQFTQCMLSFFCTCTEAKQWSQAGAIAFLLAFPKNLSQPSHVWDSWMQKACIIKQLRAAAYCLLGGAIYWEGRFIRFLRLYRFLLGGYHFYFCFSIWSPYTSIDRLGWHRGPLQKTGPQKPKLSTRPLYQMCIPELLLLEQGACITAEVPCI